MILSFPDFAAALRTAYQSSTRERMDFAAAQYTADRRTLDLLWKLKPSKYSVLCIRGAARLSQAEFARRYGIPENTWWQWERGRRTPPEYVVLLTAYAVYCDVITGALSAVPASGEW